MNLTSSARKGLAAGLALSTLVWSLAVLVVPMSVSAAPHSDGCLINAGGTISLLTGGVKRGFPTAEVFMSHGYTFSQVVAANSEDTQSTGPVMVYRDGTLVKGPSDPLVYLVANGQKRGFVSGSVFTGLGYSFANIVTAAVNTFADLPLGANLESATERHTSGVLVNASGTIWHMTATGRQGIPSMAVFNSHGFNMSYVVAANAADLSAANEGVLAARASCSGGSTPPVSGALNVSLASSNPVATSIIADTTSGDGAQAQVSGLAANFTAGSSSAVVVTVKVKRTGISANSDISNMYLYDGNMRLAEMTSYGDGLATFTNSAGLFTVPANSTRVITVKYDLANGTTSGKTIALQMTEVTLSGGAMAGGLPLVGNNMTTATVGDLGKLTINSFTSFPATADPGQTNLEVWRFNLVAADQDVEIHRLNLTMVGTVAASDLQNVKLMVSGVQIGSTQQIGANNEVTFDLSGSPYKITSGQTKTVTVHVDIVGGTSRSFKFTIRKSSDVAVRDLNYGVWLKPNQTDTLTLIEPETGNGTDINAGKLSVSRSTDSPNSTVANNASGVTLAKFDFKATGEAIKVETIVVEAVVSEDQQNLDQGKLFVDGVQVGSTVDFDSDATDDTNFTDSAADGVGAGTDEDTSFSMGNTFIIPAGATRVLTLVADTQDGDGNALAGNSTIRLSVGGIVATGQVSVSTISVATADGNVLTASSGALTTSENLAVADRSSANPTGVAGATNVRLASFIAQAGTGEGVTVTQIVLKDGMEDTNSTETLADIFQNLRVTVNGAAVGSTFATLTDTESTTYSFSVSPALTISAGAQAVIDVWADILSSAGSAAVTEANADTDGVVILDSVAGTGVSTGATADDLTDRNSQNVFVASAGTFSVTADSGSPAATLLAGTGTEVEVARFTMRETTGAEGIRITQIVVTDTSSASTSFSQVKLFVDGVQLGGTVNLSAATNGTATFSGLSYVVAANSTKTLVVKATPNVHPNGTSNSDHNFTLAASAVTAAGASSNTATNAPAVAVTSNTHSWARTSLALTGATQGATASRVRTATDKLLALTFTSGSPYQAALRGSLQANDEAATNWATVDGGNANVETASSTTAVDGTNSIRVDATTDFDVDDLLLYDTGASSVGMQNYGKVGVWLRSNKALTAGDDLAVIINDTANTTSVTQTISVPAMAVNQWYFVEAALTGLSSADRYVGIRVLSTGELASGDFLYIDNVRFYTDSLNVDVSGNLTASFGSAGKAVQLKDSSGVVKAVGYAHTTTQNVATATLIVGDDAGAAQSLSADLNFSTTATTYDVFLSSIDHVLADAGAAAEALTLNIDLGNASTDGDIRWYDGAIATTSALTWVNGTTPLQASVSYQ